MKLTHLSIGWRVALNAIAATAVLLALALAITAVNTSRTESRLLAEDMRSKVARVVDATAASDASLTRLANTQFQLFEGLFAARPWTLKEAAEATGSPRTVLLHGGEPMHQRSTEVDRFAELTGGNATVFARDGDDFVRVATSVKKEDGTRATGTRLDRAHPAYRLLLDGRRYVGRATLFGKPHMTEYVPIRQGDRVIGALYIGIGIADELAGFVRLMQSNKILDSGQVYAIDLNDGPQRGTVIGLSAVQKIDLNDPAAAAFVERLRKAAVDGAIAHDPWSVLDRGAQQDAHAYFAQVEPASKLTIVAEAHGDELNQLTRRVIVPFAVAVLIALGCLAAILVWLARRNVTRPIAQLQTSLQFLADGDLSRPFFSDRHDEVGALVRSMEQVRQRLSQSLQVVQRSTDAIETASHEIAAGNLDLSSRTEEQASSLQQTAASMEQLTATVRQSADNARQASQLALTAAQAAERGGTVVGQVVSTMDDITASSRRIENIIAVIDGIAFQTNILALNAAVEAARAGEHGRGFAVVAAEVRVLAQRSAQASKEIKGLIASSVDRVDAGSRHVAEAGEAMRDIVARVGRVTELIGEITRAAQEQSSGIGQVNEAVTQMDQATQQNAALVEQSAAAAASLKEQAGALARSVSVFRLAGVPSDARAAA